MKTRSLKKKYIHMSTSLSTAINYNEQQPFFDICIVALTENHLSICHSNKYPGGFSPPDLFFRYIPLSYSPPGLSTHTVPVCEISLLSITQPQ